MAAAYFSSTQVVIGKEIAPDALIGIYNIVGKCRRPLCEDERQKFDEFYNAQIGNKYHIPDRLPVPGMVVAVWHFPYWSPAIVTGERFISERTGLPQCSVILTDTGEELPRCPVNDSLRFLSSRFSIFLPPSLVIDKTNSRIVRYRAESSSDEENVDYLALIPQESIVPFDYKYPEEPLLKPMLDLRRQKECVLGDVLQVSAVKIKLVSATSPGDFIFVEKRHDEARRKLDEKLRELYSPLDTDEYLVPSAMVVEKLPVVALVTGDCVWMRAYVQQIIDKDICMIQPVDGAVARQVYKRNLRFVHRSLADIPKLAYRGKLAGVLPRSQVWTDAGKAAFRELAAVDQKYIVGVVNYFMIDGTAAMFLWNKNKRGEETWVGDELIRRLVGREDKTPPDRQPMRALPEKDEQAALLAECMGAMKVKETTTTTGEEVSKEKDKLISTAVGSSVNVMRPVCK